MLKIFRQKNVTKMVLWGLLILILPAFVLWGTGSLGGPRNKGPKFVGEIRGKKVSFDEFAQRITDMRCQLFLNYYDRPQILKKVFDDRAFMGRLAWDRIIMLREADGKKIRVSDKEVVDSITSLPIFLKDGRFDERFYQYILRNNLALAPRGFEEMMRENIRLKKSNDIITKDVKITDEEVAEYYRRDYEKFKISYILIPYADFKDLPAREALQHAEDERKKIKDLMASEKMTFENAGAKLGLKTAQTPFFWKTDRLEEIGSVDPLIDICFKLKDGEISAPIETEKGVLIFRISEIKKIDEEVFNKEKGEYSKGALPKKKEAYLSDWLRKLESQATLNVDLNDYEKYYR